MNLTVLIYIYIYIYISFLVGCRLSERKLTSSPGNAPEEPDPKAKTGKNKNPEVPPGQSEKHLVCWGG